MVIDGSDVPRWIRARPDSVAGQSPGPTRVHLEQGLDGIESDAARELAAVRET